MGVDSEPFLEVTLQGREFSIQNRAPKAFICDPIEDNDIITESVQQFGAFEFVDEVVFDGPQEMPSEHCTTDLSPY